MSKSRVSKKEKHASKKRKKIDKGLLRLCCEYLEKIDTVPPPVVFDVGGCIGDTLKKLQKANSNCRFCIMEPFPKNIAILKVRFPDAKIFEGVVSDAIGVEKLFVCDAGSPKHKDGSCSVYKGSSSKHDAKIVKTIDVKSTALLSVYEEFGLSKVDLLTVNCEGGEYKMFDAPGFLEKTEMVYLHMHTKCEVFMEPRYLEKRKEIVEVLKSHGFTMIAGMDDLNAISHIVQLWRKQ